MMQLEKALEEKLFVARWLEEINEIPAGTEFRILVQNLDSYVNVAVTINAILPIYYQKES